MLSEMLAQKRGSFRFCQGEELRGQAGLTGFSHTGQHVANKGRVYQMRR